MSQQTHLEEYYTPGDFAEMDDGMLVAIKGAIDDIVRSVYESASPARKARLDESVESIRLEIEKRGLSV